MKAIPIELRERILAARTEDGQSLGIISERFRIPKSTVQGIIERYRSSGTVEPKPHGGGRRLAFSSKQLRQLRRQLLKQPDATLAQLRKRIKVYGSIATFHRAIKKLGFTLKKSDTRSGAKTRRCDCTSFGMARTNQSNRYISTGFYRRDRRKNQHDTFICSIPQG